MEADGNLDHDINDLENYASDASENDDIIDDDQELLALLRGEHAALRDPASSSTEISDEVPAPSTLNQATTQSLTGEPKVLFDTLLLDQRQKQQQQEQQQGARPRPSALRALSEALERGRDATGFSRLASSSSVFLGTPVAADTIPARSASALQETHSSFSTSDYNDFMTAASMDEGNVLDEAPTSLISRENNIALTNVIRTQATQSLAVNRIYQDLLVKHLQEVSIARTRNRALYAQLQDLIQMQEGGQHASVLPTTTTRLYSPYFVDQDGETPPENEDIIKRKRRSYIDPGAQKRWTERERQNLRAGVISENKRILFETFSEAGDVDGIRALSSVSDAEMMVNTKGLDWNRISQRFVDTRTAKECLIQWTGMDHPGISQADWSSEEISKLEELAKKYQERNWIQIALDLGTNRTSAQCFRKYMSRKATRGLSKE
ncbi:Myblike DNAbinding domain-containing protein [Mortierella sp. NVP85]|nr:Myblike DNAbinding domain-containing protein [Mortierella sp. NVP85]